MTATLICTADNGIFFEDMENGFIEIGDDVESIVLSAEQAEVLRQWLNERAADQSNSAQGES